MIKQNDIKTSNAVMIMEIRSHQQLALKRFEQYYYNEGNVRGVLSMCCGSGKTFTVFNIMKHCIQCYDEKLFIFATSRKLLIKQVANDFLNWFAQAGTDCMVFLKVSETYVFKQNNGTKFRNYDYLKTRISDDVRLKLFTDNKVVIILTTYDGSKDIVSSFDDYNKTNPPNALIPDLIILDEAHNTAGAGENERKLSQSLIVQYDENTLFSPQKLLFVTATPLKIIKQNTSSTYVNDETIYSMDNTVIYGNVFYEYSFKNGIKDGYIVDWETIFLKRSCYDEEQNGLDTDSIKKQLCEYDKETINILYFYISASLLIRIINKYCMHNIIVYLSDITQVKVFDACLQMIKNSSLMDIEVYSVHDKNTTSCNKCNREKFENKGCINLSVCKILLSVSVFDEGIDIKECDCVMFATPRSSETTIVQNIGRALRKYETIDTLGNKYEKQKAYVIISTPIHEIEDSSESVYSSKYNKIRQISDKMREDDVDVMYKRKVKVKNSLLNPTDNEEVEEKSAFIDDKITVDSQICDEQENITTKTLSTITKSEFIGIAKDIAQSFEPTSTNHSISNIPLDTIRTIARQNEIKSLSELGELLDSKKIVSIPHKNYKNEFICYAELLFGEDEVYSFEEARTKIKELDLSRITEPKEWIAYCKNVFDKALQGDIDNNEELDILMRIPYNPKDYYIEEWNKDNNSNGWIEFLGKDLINTIGIEVKCDSVPISTNAFNNISNILNNDHKKVKRFKPLEWQTYDTETRLDILKDYLYSEFGVNCTLEIRVQLNKKMLLDRFVINAHVANMDYTFIPITIYPDCSIQYDKCIYDKQLVTKRTTPIRSEKKYICEASKQALLKNLNSEIKEFFKSLSGE